MKLPERGETFSTTSQAALDKLKEEIVESKREYINLGLVKYNKKGNMWKTKGSKEKQWHFISAHKNPMLDPMGDPVPIMLCSCPDFTIGIAAHNGNPFVTPCKHILGFSESEVSIELLEGSVTSQGIDGS